MRHVLIVKTSSMGDVIHTLPALSDAQASIPNIRFDWVVEEDFQEIPAWHPAVEHVIPVAIRRWRRNLLASYRGKEIRQFKSELKKRHYDLVIDAQGLIKSAWIARQIDTPCAGFDKKSVREPLAAMAYQMKISVAKNLHAVERTRQLFASALNYTKPAEVGRYQLNKSRFQHSEPAEKSLVFLHSTTRFDKHWPEPYWCELCQMVEQLGYRVKLPWGTEKDKQRGRHIASCCSNVDVLPKLNLKGVASVINQADGVVAVDTGLGHLSAALDIPTISLYGPTSPALVGAYGKSQVHLVATEFKPVKDLDESIVPAVFRPLTPDIVFQQLKDLLA